MLDYVRVIKFRIIIISVVTVAGFQNSVSVCGTLT